MKINKVMMVDDDADIRRIGEISLARVGMWIVSLCPSATVALDLLDSEQPDVILLDVMMPGLDGVAALSEFLRKTKGQIPIIFMTARVMNHEIGRYLELGAAGVISKPFEPMSLPAEIKSIVTKYYADRSAMLCV